MLWCHANRASHYVRAANEGTRNFRLKLATGLRPSTVKGTNQIGTLTINRGLEEGAREAGPPTVDLNGASTTFTYHMQSAHYASTTPDATRRHVLLTQANGVCSDADHITVVSDSPRQQQSSNSVVWNASGLAKRPANVLVWRVTTFHVPVREARESIRDAYWK